MCAWVWHTVEWVPSGYFPLTLNISHFASIHVCIHSFFHCSFNVRFVLKPSIHSKPEYNEFSTKILHTEWCIYVNHQNIYEQFVWLLELLLINHRAMQMSRFSCWLISNISFRIKLINKYNGNSPPSKSTNSLFTLCNEYYASLGIFLFFCQWQIENDNTFCLMKANRKIVNRKLKILDACHVCMFGLTENRNQRTCLYQHKTINLNKIRRKYAQTHQSKRIKFTHFPQTVFYLMAFLPLLGH